MKQTTTLLFVIILSLFTACSSDDDSNTSTETVNALIGTWSPVKEVDRCPNQNDDEFFINECGMMSTVSFLENGVFSFSSFGIDGVTETCENFSNGQETWRIEDGVLFITDEGVEDEVEFFEVVGNTLRVGEPDNDFCEGGLFFTEFSRQ